MQDRCNSKSTVFTLSFLLDLGRMELLLHIILMKR